MQETNWNADEDAYVLKSSITLPVDRESLFEFFSDAFQLEKITPTFLKFRVLTPAPIVVQQGTLIDYSLKLHGVPIRWQTEISSWDPPFSFTDRQLKGPYSLWEHFHTFDATDAGTIVNDTVKYRVPGGPLIHSLLVKKDLLRIFAYRQSQMIQLFESGNPDQNTKGTS